MIISLFDNIHDRNPKPVECTWEELCTMLCTHSHPAEKSLAPLWSPAEFRDGGRLRNVDVVRVHAAVYDIDSVSSADMAKTLQSLHLMSVAFLYHTTWSRHVSEDAVRARLVLKLSGPILREHWGSAWDAIHELIGHVGDTACRDAARRYYMPSSPEEHAARDFRLIHGGAAIGEQSVALPEA